MHSESILNGSTLVATVFGFAAGVFFTIQAPVLGVICLALIVANWLLMRHRLNA